MIKDLTLKTADGEDFGLSELAGKPVAVQFVRYYGCLPCQEYLQSFSDDRERFESAGIQTLCVGGSADYQARWLADNGVAVQMLLDPEQQFREAIGFGNIGANLLHPKGAASYAKALARGRRPMKITKDTIRTPGAIVLDDQLEIAWRYEGKVLGDYPELDEFFAAAKSAVPAAV